MHSPEIDSAETITVLIVDDEAHNRKVVKNHLNKLENIEILESGDSKEAIEVARDSMPDLILLDIMMPEQDGFETCRQLKQMEPTRDIPVIFLSALDDVESKKTGFQAGGVDYVSKPFQAEELISRVNTHVTLQKQRNKLRTYSRELESMVQERTKELQAQYEELNKSEALYRTIFETTHNPTMIVEPDDTIGLCNSAFASLTGETKEEIEGKRKWYEYVHPDFKQKMLYYREMRYKDPVDTPKSYEILFVTPNNENRIMWVSADLISGSNRIVASLLDMTEQKNYEAELEKQVFYDPLTSLANRTLLLNRIKKAMERQRQDQSHLFAIIFLDIDRFQMINESLGHLAGDKLLQ
ncbi:MAG: response regulator, partial [Thermodesulfobacteriota bacterium]